MPITSSWEFWLGVIALLLGTFAFGVPYCGYGITQKAFHEYSPSEVYAKMTSILGWFSYVSAFGLYLIFVYFLARGIQIGLFALGGLFGWQSLQNTVGNAVFVAVLGSFFVIAPAIGIWYLNAKKRKQKLAERHIRDAQIGLSAIGIANMEIQRELKRIKEAHSDDRGND